MTVVVRFDGFVSDPVWRLFSDVSHPFDIDALAGDRAWVVSCSSGVHEMPSVAAIVRAVDEAEKFAEVHIASRGVSGRVLSKFLHSLRVMMRDRRRAGWTLYAIDPFGGRIDALLVDRWGAKLDSGYAMASGVSDVKLFFWEPI